MTALELIATVAALIGAVFVARHWLDSEARDLLKNERICEHDDYESECEKPHGKDRSQRYDEIERDRKRRRKG